MSVPRLHFLKTFLYQLVYDKEAIMTCGLKKFANKCLIIIPIAGLISLALVITVCSPDRAVPLRLRGCYGYEGRALLAVSEHELAVKGNSQKVQVDFHDTNEGELLQAYPGIYATPYGGGGIDLEFAQNGAVVRVFGSELSTIDRAGRRFLLNKLPCR